MQSLYINDKRNTEKKTAENSAAFILLNGSNMIQLAFLALHRIEEFIIGLRHREFIDQEFHGINF